ncbi:MAG: site-specific DNA-methyltransferase [Cyanobacteria bacterium]|nr:site-specific DNA-methyltransferase [Cyanobacteriota bacterium]
MSFMIQSMKAHRKTSSKLSPKGASKTASKAASKNPPRGKGDVTPLDIQPSDNLASSLNSDLSESLPTENKAKSKAPRVFDRTLAYSDIDVTRWRDYEAIETDSLWMIGNRERKNGHQLDYHGNCVPQILTQLLTRFTKEGEVLLDLFLGSGTSAIEAVNLNRKAIGVELKAEMVEHVRKKLEEQGKSQEVQILQGDSSDKIWTGKAIDRALQSFEKEKADFLFLHPPYADIIRFSDFEKDLSNAPTTEAFLDLFEKVCQLGFDSLSPGRFAGLVIGDKYTQGELIPLGFQCMERMNQAGFITKSIIVKNITGNEKAKGRMNNLWRYRALVGGFYVFKHEYVMLFQKPLKKKK